MDEGRMKYLKGRGFRHKAVKAEFQRIREDLFDG